MKIVLFNSSSTSSDCLYELKLVVELFNRCPYLIMMPDLDE